MQLHQLQAKTKRKKAKVIGRGGNRGTTAGRGTKGQKAHGVPRPELRDILKKIPKKRGYGKNRNLRPKDPATPVSLAAISKVYKDGETVSPETLLEKGLIEKRSNRLPRVKILANGKLSVKVSVGGCTLSDAAKKAVEAGGGKIS